MEEGHQKGGIVARIAKVFVCLFGFSTFGLSQSPGNLNSDINPSNGFSSVGAIEATYNNARRQEEAQLGLGSNAISNLDLPSQSEWDSYTDDRKALYILNDERVSRNGINYGQGPVRGYPFAGVAQKIDQVSQSYAQVLMDQDAFTHTYGGTSPSSRITSGVGSSCKEFTSRSENLYGAVSTQNSGFPNVVAQAMYGFIYDDAGSNWGHREMCLLQDKDLAGNNWGFTDNHGDSQEEGFIGVGIVRGTNWSAFGSNWAYGVVLVLNYFDPVSSGCSYNVTESLPGGSTSPIDGPDDCPSLLSFSNEDIDGVQRSAALISIANGTQVTGPTVFAAADIEINGTFEVNSGTCLELSTEGCQYTGTLECDPPIIDITPGSGSGTCTDPYPMICGTILQGNTNVHTNTWSTYFGSTFEWSGPDAIFNIQQPAGEIITITLDQLQADLDLFVIQSCTNSLLLASTKVGTSSESLSISAVSSTRILTIVIDGYNGASSPYRMALTCHSNAVTNTQTVGQKSIENVTKKASGFSKVCEPYIERK